MICKQKLHIHRKNIEVVNFYMLKEGNMHFAVVQLKELESLTIAFRLVFSFSKFAGANITNAFFHMLRKYTYVYMHCRYRTYNVLEDAG